MLEKGGSGFPTFLFLDEEGEVIKNFYPKSEQDFRLNLEELTKFIQAKKSYLANPEDLKIKIQYYLSILQAKPSEDMYDEADDEILEALEKHSQAGELTKAQAQLLKQILASPKINQIMEETRTSLGAKSDQKAKLQALGPKFYILYKQGYWPQFTNPKQFFHFWTYLALYCETQKDSKTMEVCIQKLNQLPGDATTNARIKKTVADLEKRVALIKEKK